MYLIVFRSLIYTVMALLVCLPVSINTHTIIQQKQDGASEESRAEPSFASCINSINGSIPMLGPIPNEYSNIPGLCETFYICEERLGADPQPMLMYCPLGPTGRIHYDFFQCRCENIGEATCYDNGNPEHRKNLFNCATPAPLQG